MILSLEVLQAKHGDCLLLHYGEQDNQRLIVIDGGPSGVFKDNLNPRLLEIKSLRSPDEPLPLSMVMVSHLDDDHVNGILQLIDDSDQENDQESFVIKNLWVNTFDDIIGNIQLPVISGISASSVTSINTLPTEIKQADHGISAVIASTGQGRKLNQMADKLSIAVNKPFTKLGTGKAALVRGDVKMNPVQWEELSITVLQPDEKRLKNLQKQWDKDLKKAQKKGDNSIIFASLTDLDTSPFNLSSIVCLVEMEGKTILLTGDGRSDDIYEGLKLNNRLNEAGKLHVDILKMPHHGSIRNMKQDFLEKITADHYVISADGRDDNPDGELLNTLAQTVKKGTVYFTNADGKNGLKEKLDTFQDKLKTENNEVKVVFRNHAPMLIHLLEGFDIQ